MRFIPLELWLFNRMQWACILVSSKLDQGRPGYESDSGIVGVTSEAMPAGNKEAWKFYLKSLYIFIKENT